MRIKVLSWLLIFILCLGIICTINRTRILIVRNREKVLNEKSTILNEIELLKIRMNKIEKDNNYLNCNLEFLMNKNDLLKKEIKEKEKIIKASEFMSTFSKFLNFVDSYEEYLTKKSNKYDINHRESISVEASAYVMGHTTSTGKRARVGFIAGSKDLIDKWGYGSKIILYKLDNNNKICVDGVYHLEDRMNDRYTKTVDIRMNDYNEAIEWGRRKMYAVKL